MKKQSNSAKALMMATLILMVSGCAITIKHTFDQPPVVVNNYYQGGGGSGNPNVVNAENNTLSTEGLGVGYDVVWTDPENWTKNSVQRDNQGGGIRPRVFKFLPDPDPNATIDIPKLNRDATRRRKPLGVNAETNAEFKWEDKMVYVSNASDFQTANKTSVSAGGGFAGVAFSASASFGNVQQKTAEKGKTVASKNGAFRGLKMEIDLDKPQQFTPEFIDAVQKLDDKPATYSAFIKKWGTHFSKAATIGAKCAYTLEFSNSELSTRYETSTAFDASVSGSMAGVSAEASAGYSDDKKEAIKNSTGAENITFVSFGGSGQGIKDFAAWTEAAIDNPTMIDAYLIPYDALFSKKFFPKDNLIDQKQIRLKAALENYYVEEQARVDKLPKADPIVFSPPKPQTFKITATYLYVRKGHKGQERLYHGIIPIGVYDNLGNTIDFRNVLNLNGGTNGSNKHYLELKQAEKHETKISFEVTLPQDKIAGAFVAISGAFYQQWGVHHSMGNKLPMDAKKTVRVYL